MQDVGIEVNPKPFEIIPLERFQRDLRCLYRAGFADSLRVETFDLGLIELRSCD